jgi:hypothetical protein
LGLFLITSKEHRKKLLQPGLWVMVLVAGICSLPILIWNIQHDWVTIRHVTGLAGLSQGLRWHWLVPLVYIGTQFGLLLGYWFIVWVAAMFAYRPWRNTSSTGTLFLWCFSAPMFLVFLVFSVKTGGGEPNWPITAYISGLVLTAAWLAEQLATPSLRWRFWTKAGLAAACSLGLVVNLAMHESTWFYPVLKPIAGRVTEERSTPLRRVDPSCRLKGWRTLAEEVDRLVLELKRQGHGPVIAATSWSLPGQLGFYCDGHPVVYSIGLPLGDRHSQYDFWRPNPVADPSEFAGRTFLIVSTFPLNWLTTAFEKLDPPHTVTHFENGEPVAQWLITVAWGYKGFPKAAGLPPYKRLYSNGEPPGLSRLVPVVTLNLLSPLNTGRINPPARLIIR